MPPPFESRYATPAESPGFLLWQVTNTWQRQQRAALEPLGLTHVQFVLLAGVAWLTRTDAPLTQTQLARHARTDLMMTSQVLRTLESKGLIARDRHPTDSRARCLRVTDAGRALAARAIGVVEEVDRVFFAALGEEQAALVAALQILTSAGPGGPAEL